MIANSFGSPFSRLNVRQAALQVDISPCQPQKLALAGAGRQSQQDAARTAGASGDALHAARSRVRSSSDRNRVFSLFSGLRSTLRHGCTFTGT